MAPGHARAQAPLVDATRPRAPGHPFLLSSFFFLLPPLSSLLPFSLSCLLSSLAAQEQLENFSIFRRSLVI
jgi:hypothetical protein